MPRINNRLNVKTVSVNLPICIDYSRSLTDISTRKPAQEKGVHGPTGTEGGDPDIREH